MGTDEFEKMAKSGQKTLDTVYFGAFLGDFWLVKKSLPTCPLISLINCDKKIKYYI